MATKTEFRLNLMPLSETSGGRRMAGREASEILALLALNTPAARAEVEERLGKKILKGPPARGCYQNGADFLERLRGYIYDKDELTYVRAVFPRPSTGRKLVSLEGEGEIVPGRTIRQIMARGVTRRVIEKAVREGWVELARKL